MKKIISVILFAALLVTSLAANAFAAAYMEGDGVVEFSIKKADPSAVKKDGIIDVAGGEYEKINIDTANLDVRYGKSAYFGDASAMAKTMEYYFSWDETDGGRLNFAVKYNADAGLTDPDYQEDFVTHSGFHTDFAQGTPDANGTTGDDFCNNLGLLFVATYNYATTRTWFFYYGIGMDIETGAPLTATFANQLGADGKYSATMGQDFTVSYPGDAWVVYEWSIPFADFTEDGLTRTAGQTCEFSIVATAGEVDPDNRDTWYNNCWAVSLGQYGWMMDGKRENKTNAVVTLLGDTLQPSGQDNPGTTDPGTTDPGTTNPGTTNPGTTSPIETDPPTTAPVLDEKVNEDGSKEITYEDGTKVVIDKDGTQTITDKDGNKTVKPTTTAPQTGDPMIIAAAVSAISACGIVVAKKRRG